MSFLHSTHPLRKMNMELLVLLIAAMLLIVSLLIINLFHQFPRERAVPAPILATSSSASTPVHFSKLQGSTSITEAPHRNVPDHATAPAPTSLKEALQQLLAGPTAEEEADGYYSEIPKGTRLLGVQVKHNIVQINLSKEFTEGGGSTSMIQRVSEIKSTVQAAEEGTRRIQIAIEGKPLNVLGGEGLELN